MRTDCLPWGVRLLFLAGPSNTRISCGGGAEPPSQRADPVSCIRLFDGASLSEHPAPVASGRQDSVSCPRPLRKLLPWTQGGDLNDRSHRSVARPRRSTALKPDMDPLAGSQLSRLDEAAIDGEESGFWTKADSLLLTALLAPGNYL